MRPRFATRPSRADLLTNPLHVTVRDFPETLRILLRQGIEVTKNGTTSLEALVGPEAPVVDELVKAVAWRPDATKEGTARVG